MSTTIIPLCSAASFEVNSEPHTGARPSVRLCVGPELARCVHLNRPRSYNTTKGGQREKGARSRWEAEEGGRGLNYNLPLKSSNHKINNAARHTDDNQSHEPEEDLLLNLAFAHPVDDPSRLVCEPHDRVHPPVHAFDLFPVPV